MSIRIGTSGSTSKNVIDVKTGASSSAFKNINLVKDWNGKIIWQRITTKDITGKLSFSTDPSTNDFYEYGYDETEYEYTDKLLDISNVRYTGTSPATAMTEGIDYEVTYTGDTSGTIYHSGYGSASKNATAHITGIGNYTGTVDVPYTITHENKQYVATNYYFSLSYSNCTLTGATGTKLSDNFIYSTSNTITATVSSSDSSKPYISMNGEPPVVSPYTFTCYNAGSKGSTADFSFKAVPEPPDVKISSMAFTGPIGAFKSQKFAGTYANAHLTKKITVTLSSGKTIDFYGKGGTSEGVTVSVTQGSADPSNPYKYNDGESGHPDVNLYTYNATATGDDTTVGGSASASALCVN